MASQKADVRQHTYTVSFSDKELDLLEVFAAEQGIDDLSEAIPALLHELVRLNDALWDTKLSEENTAVDKLAREALEEHQAGLTEDFDD